MKRPQITPGPWTQNADTVWRKIGSANQPIIIHPNYSAMAQNDARAIAALPALLEALELAEATIQRLAPDGSRATQGTRDVIANALRLAGYEF